MRFKFASLGTRGDLQPLLAVAHSLVKMSHKVIFATSPIFKNNVESAGVDFEPLGSVTKCYMDSLIDCSKLVPADDLSKFYSSRLVFSDLNNITQKLSEFIDDSVFVVNRIVYDVLIASQLREKIKHLNVFLYCPFEQPLVQRLDLDRNLVKIVGIPNWAIPRAIPWLESKSWKVFGFCLGNEGSEHSLPDGLKSFLADERKTLVLTMGSMLGFDYGLLLYTLDIFAKKLGFKIIAQSGWNCSEVKSSDSIFLCNDIRHATLFKYCDYILHHGGAGTTATALKAGLGAIVFPQVGDQFYWAWFLKEIGKSAGTLKSENDEGMEVMLKRLLLGEVVGNSRFSGLVDDASDDVAHYLTSE